MSFTFSQFREGVFTGPCPTPTDESGHAMIIVGYGSTIKNGTNYDYWVIVYIFLSLTLIA